MIKHWTKSAEARTIGQSSVGRRWMQRRWIDYIICLAMPHVALLIGLAFLARGETPEHNKFGLRLVWLSLIIMAAGSLLYYIFFTPFFGLD